jgi:hypothetical protein
MVLCYGVMGCSGHASITHDDTLAELPTSTVEIFQLSTTHGNWLQ